MITPLPTPVPSRNDPTTFAARGDAFLAALPTFATESNELASTVNAQYNAIQAAASAAGGVAVAASTAAASAAAAAKSAQAAQEAWVASTYPTEQLAAISQSLHYGAVVKSIVYNTGEDSDGGAWRKRCQHLSWYNETLGGDKWVGQRANEASARFDIPNAVDGSLWSVVGTTTVVANGYYESTGDTGYLSLPTTNVAAITGDFEIIVKVNLADWSNGAARYIVGRYFTGANTKSYQLTVSTAGVLLLYVSDGVTAVQTLACSVAMSPTYDGVTVWLKVTFDADNGSNQKVATFYTSLDGSSWVQLGIPSVSAGAIVLGTANTQPINIGTFSGVQPLTGKVYYAEVKNGIGGETVAKFDGSTIIENTSNACYQNTTDGKFYKLTIGSGVTEVFRGISREFPAVAGIVAESLRLVIYDLTAPGCPMWMVTVPVLATTGGWEMWRTLRTISGLRAKDGAVYFSFNFASVGGVAGIRLLADQLVRHGVGGSGGVSATNVALRNVPPTAPYVRSYPNIVNDTVNDVAITALDGAPTDVATGMPVPTIYAFTASGVSRIAHDGTVSNCASLAVTSGYIEAPFVRSFSSSVVGLHPLDIALPAGNVALDISTVWSSYGRYALSLTPSVLSGITRGAKTSMGGMNGLSTVKESPSNPAVGMSVNITNNYNTGWMPGDIRGAYLADTTAEAITASGELVTNGTFTTDTSGWAASGTGTAPNLSVVSGAMRVTTTEASKYAFASRSITTVIGKTYTFTGTVVTDATVATFGFWLGTVTGAGNLGTVTATATGSLEKTFVATTTTTYIDCLIGTTCLLGDYVDFDNISVKLAEPDRSVKNNGLIINGSLTKTAVASGANLVEYSGFSATNYLEQPFNNLFDVSTGDFCILGWVKLTSLASQQRIISRGSAGAPTLSLYVSNTGVFAYVCHATGAAVATTVAAVLGWQLVELSRIAGVLYLRANGTQVYNIANTVNLDNPLAKLTIGVSNDYASPMLGSLALLRISATAPSAEQSAHIYRTELPLLQPNAQCTIAGSSTAVTALAHDESTDLLHVGTSWGRSSFKDLVRVDSEATTTGSLTSLSAVQGMVLTGGTSAKVYVPAMTLREELVKPKSASNPSAYPQYATLNQTVFYGSPNLKTVAVYVKGMLKSLGSDYTISSDGFKDIVTMSYPQPAFTDVTLMQI